jgi:Ca2+-binding RTX toxin-like protein
MLMSIRALRLVTAGGLVVAALVVRAPAAGAVAADCTYDAGTKAVTVTLLGGDYDSHTLGRSVAGAIELDAVACQGATVTNTDSVAVSAGPGQQTFTIDMGNGPFSPGATAEGAGQSEIEFTVALGQGTDQFILSGSPQADRLSFLSSTKARMNGDTDADVTIGDTETFSLYGGGGNDTLLAKGDARVTFQSGGGGDDTLIAGDDGESLDGGKGNDVLNAGDGDDYLHGGGGADMMSGGYGEDSITPGPGDDVVDAGPGNDNVYFYTAPDGADTVTGGYGSDYVGYSSRTNGVTVSLDGVAGDGEPGENDNIGADVESLDGGSGNDTLTGNALDNSISGFDGFDTIRGGDGSDAISDGTGNDFIYGGAGDDFLWSNDGDDTVSGEGGDDSFSTGVFADGSDTFSGGRGWDTANYANRLNALTLVVGGTANGEVGENDSFTSDVETLYGGSGPDTITGSLGNNTLDGNGGNDTISGLAGADSLYGGPGNDDLTGGDGYDYIQGDDNADTLHLVDNAYDSANCGAGTDDASDRDAADNDLTGCETT